MFNKMVRALWGLCREVLSWLILLGTIWLLYFYTTFVW